MDIPAYRVVSQALFYGFLSFVLMTPVSPPSTSAPLVSARPPPPARLVSACLPLLCRLRRASGAWTLEIGDCPAPLGPEGALATAGSGFCASGCERAQAGRPESDLWFLGGPGGAPL